MLYPTKLLFDEAGLFNIRQLYCYIVLVHHFKNLDSCPIVEHLHSTRYRLFGSVRVPRMIKSIGQRHFGYVGPRLFNVLKSEATVESSFNKFRRQIRRWIVEKGIDFYETVFRQA